MWEAIASGEALQVQQLLQQGVDVAEQDAEVLCSKSVTSEIATKSPVRT